MTIINGVDLHYIDKGKGTAIIFIHPPVLSSDCFTHQIQELSRYFRVIAFDIRGHGKSAPSKQPLTYPLIVEDIKQLMNHLNIDKAFLCGYSAGGSIVLEFLLTYPDKAAGGIVIGGLPEVTDRRLIVKIGLGAVLAKLGAIRTLALLIAWSNSDSLGVFWKSYQNAKKSNAKNAEEYYWYCIKYNCSDQLGKITQPLLLLYGEEDKGLHHYANQIHEQVSTSQLILIPKVNHQIPGKAAAALNAQLMRFVKEHPQQKQLLTGLPRPLSKAPKVRL